MTSRAGEWLRRAYVALVARRSTVRIERAAPVETLAAPPVFVAGLYRSGTTLLRYVLDSHSQICCPPETDFMAPLRALLEDERYSRGLADMGFDRPHVVERLRYFLLYFYQNYARSCAKPRWADKSPSYVDHLPFIRELFPETRFVLLHRHGLDVAHSFTRDGSFEHPALTDRAKAAEDLRVTATRYWTEKTGCLQRFQDTYPRQCHGLRYEDLCDDPRGSLGPLLSFLDLAWEEGVLRFHEQPHDAGREGVRASVTTGFSRSGGHYASWPDEVREEALAIAAETLQALGYAASAQSL